MKKHIVCFGDSNTYGLCTDPEDCATPSSQRYNENERWPCLLQGFLGDEYLVLEEGLSGRTIAFEDPTHEGRCGIDYIMPCLESHSPVSMLIIMLGTNDLKERFSANATTIAQCMERFLQKALSVDCWLGQPKILLINPPKITKEMEKTDAYNIMGPGCPEKYTALTPLLKDLARKRNCLFYDAADCQTNSVDHIHLLKKGHVELASFIAQLVKTAGI